MQWFISQLTAHVEQATHNLCLLETVRVLLLRLSSLTHVVCETGAHTVKTRTPTTSHSARTRAHTTT